MSKAVEQFLKQGGSIEVVPPKSSRRHKKVFKSSDYSKTYDSQVRSGYAYSHYLNSKV